MEVTFAKGILKKAIKKKIKENANIDVNVDFNKIEVETTKDYVIFRVQGECAIKKEDILNL